MKKLLAATFAIAAASFAFTAAPSAQAGPPRVPGTCEILNNTACDGNPCHGGNELPICDLD